MSLLCAFIRTRTDREEDTNLREDVQEAMRDVLPKSTGKLGTLDRENELAKIFVVSNSRTYFITFNIKSSSTSRMDIQGMILGLENTGYFFVHEVCLREIPEVVTSLGDIRVDLRSPEPIRTIRPQPMNEAKANTLSSRYGMGSFPFHTDVAHWSEPAHFVLLYCEHPGSGARPTHLQDYQVWNLESEVKRAALREVWKTGTFRPQLEVMSIGV